MPFEARPLRDAVVVGHLARLERRQLAPLLQQLAQQRAAVRRREIP